MVRFVFGLLLLSIVGCGVGGGIQPAVIPEDLKSTSDRPLVAHPEYSHWSQFPEGSYSIRRKEVVGKNGKTIVTTKVQLKSKTAEKVSVEMQVTVKRGDDPERVNDPDVTDYPAQFQLPEGMQEEQFSLPSLKAKFSGEEALEVDGQKYECKKYVWTETNEAGPMEVTVWRSDNVPGRTVKEVSATQNVAESSSEQIIEVKIGSEESK